jgi:hypothetical protein
LRELLELARKERYADTLIKTRLVVTRGHDRSTNVHHHIVRTNGLRTVRLDRRNLRQQQIRGVFAAGENAVDAAEFGVWTVVRISVEK